MCIFFIQPLPQENLFMKTVEKLQSPAHRPQTIQKLLFAMLASKAFPTERLSEVKGYMKQFQKMSLQF